MTINNQHGGPCRNSKAVFEGGKFCLPNVIEVKATEVGILIVLETFFGLKLTCMGIFARDHRVKVTIQFQSKAQQESVKRSNTNNGKILRNSPTSSYWPRSKKEKKSSAECKYISFYEGAVWQRTSRRSGERRKKETRSFFSVFTTADSRAATLSRSLEKKNA